MIKEMSLAEHAEAWWQEQNKIVPLRDTTEWETMYKEWIEFAFQDFGEKNVGRIYSKS